MIRRLRWCCAVLLGVTALPVAAHAEHPAARTETVIATDGDIVVSRVRLADQLPPGSPPHPPACDEIEYLRYRSAGGADDPQSADGVLLAQTAAFFGATSMEPLARNTIHQLAARGTHVEWWTQPRRSTCAFDYSGIAAADRARDGRVAFDYYFGDKEIEGRRFGGFRPNSELRYLAEIGLARNVADIHTVLLRELPDPEFRARKTFCGGPSDGGLIVGAFAAWDFGGGPQRAGYRQCAGFFALESLINADVLGLQSVPALAATAPILGGLPYELAVAGLRSGGVPVSFSGIPFVEPQFMALLAVLGSAAWHRPDEESGLAARIVATWQNEIATRGAFAATYDEFLTGADALREYRFTDEGLLGMLTSEHTFSFSPLQFSIGAPAGGPVAEKEFPWRDSAVANTPLGPLARIVTGPGPRVAPTDKHAVYGWHDYDDLADVPYAPADSAVVSIRDLARAMAAAPGDGMGFVDPYFTARLSIDLQAAHTGVRTGDLAPLRYDAEARNRPILTVFGTESWPLLPAGAVGALPADTVYIHGYTHADSTLGAERQNNGKPEPMAAALTEFVTRHLS
ncbi:hypothetical protein [Nocardia sp. NPDC052566]|uniref:hypothetical protein n=1 Tax=Nocardia sp. NPDC052566 TaxID=3364330 RepID=UPI0037CC5203